MTPAPRALTLHRRAFLAATAATVFLPYAARAQSASGDQFETEAGPITIHPVDHASFVMETPAGVIYVDPVGGAEAYADLPAPDLILLTHEHADHFDLPTLEGLAEVPLITNPAVHDMLPEPLKARATAMANGDSGEILGYPIEAVPAYNLTPERQQYHPQGRDNGYVIEIGGFRTYIAGDTEDTPEFRSQEDIDLAFVPMNLPYTMDVAQAAEGVAEMAPTYVYPYHFRGQDPAEFARLIGESPARVEVRMGPWYKA